MSKMNPTIKMTDNFWKTRRETKQNNKQKNFGLAARALILCSANEPEGFLIDTSLVPMSGALRQILSVLQVILWFDHFQKKEQSSSGMPYPVPV